MPDMTNYTLMTMSENDLVIGRAELDNPVYWDREKATFTVYDKETGAVKSTLAFDNDRHVYIHTHYGVVIPNLTKDFENDLRESFGEDTGNTVLYWLNKIDEYTKYGFTVDNPDEEEIEAAIEEIAEEEDIRVQYASGTYLYSKLREDAIKRVNTQKFNTIELIYDENVSINTPNVEESDVDELEDLKQMAVDIEKNTEGTFNELFRYLIDTLDASSESERTFIYGPKGYTYTVTMAHVEEEFQMTIRNLSRETEYKFTIKQ